MSLFEAMTPNDSSFDPQALLAQIAWVRRLARSLVPSDLHTADDVTQEACLAALEHRPDSTRPLAAWLAEVARNLVRQNRRGESRRGIREELAARGEALPSTHDVVEQLSVHREIVDAVMQLDEPYRTTIVLRYFEELSPSAIAKRERVPVATVKTRLARGLDRLRVRLDHDHGGDGRSWLLALIPICKPSSGAVAATTLGAFVVSTSIKVGLAAAVVAGGIFVFWPKHAESNVAANETTAAIASETVVPVAKPKYTEPFVDETAHDERAVVAAAAPKHAAVETKPAAALAPWHGVVLDLQSRPVANVHICIEGGSALIDVRELALPSTPPHSSTTAGISDSSGRFEIAAQEHTGALLACDENLSTVLAALCAAGAATSERVVVVAPRLEYRGRVVDESGRAVSGARVEARLPRDLRSRLAHNLDNSTERGWLSPSNDDGSFAMPEVPRVTGMELVTTHDGFLPSERPAPDSSASSIEIVLRRPSAAPGTVSGEVVDARGRGVGAARVSLDSHTTVADGEGRFTIEIPKGGAKSPIVALKPGYLPASEVLSAAVQSGAADAAEYVILHLGGPPLAIEGRVVDADGHPQAGMKVWVDDSTFFGGIDEMPATVEGVLAGAAMRDDIERMVKQASGSSDPEKMLQEVPTVFWNFVKTDSDGKFKIEGLLDREYTIAALDPETLLRIENGPIRAGRKDALVELPADAYHERVSGRVVARNGKPLAGVRVTPRLDVVSVHPTPNSTTSYGIDTKGTVTDHDGRFTLARFPRQKAFLEFQGENILPLVYGAGKPDGKQGFGESNKDLVITVALRYHMQIELAADRADSVDSMKVLDENGGKLEINVFAGRSQTSSDILQLHAGRSPVVVVSEDAKTVVLLKDEKEVQRVSLALVPEGVNVVRP